MSRFSFVLLLLFILMSFTLMVNSQQVNHWKGNWISDYVQNNPKYYQASISDLKCSQVKFILNVSSGSAVNVAVKKNSIPSFSEFDYRATSVENGITYVYNGLDQMKDQIYVIVNGARSAWNLYSLNFECF